MVIGTAQYASRNRLFAQNRPSVVRPLSEKRCFDCRLRDSQTSPSKYCLNICPHKTDFAPTPNPFGALAGLSQSPTESN
ncbi:hypothetical protein HBH56_060500 [Parastagonospora nodorum]|nr:hypothetical protein HBH56_060500 [Parastagonospora nodorum]KAH3930998.1 hypothetical protein HBH54_104430 [Parastagonospora nodorum]KAH4140738.1 hypothetical protein HBH45_077330 [Parastagonospora nodorum]KAH4167831.1 hypothetical protein HBH44_053190 [Parastagonospora nodorum]KAH4178596.1 hypothetical protein HBH43_026260 [Parastagonospora nodorum]